MFSPGVKINIRVSDKPPNGFSSGYSEPPLSSPPPDSNSTVGSLSPTPQRIFSPSDAGAAHGAFPSQIVTPENMGRTASPQVTRERNPSPNGLPSPPTGVGDKPRCIPREDDDNASSTEHVVTLEMRAAQTERDRRIAQLNDQLVQKSALLEQAEANAAEAMKRAGLEKRELQAKLGEMLLSRDQALEQAQSALRTTSRAAVTEEPSQLERELAEVRAKLNARESELAAVRLRLTDRDAEDGWAERTKAEEDKLHTVTAASLFNLNEDQAMCEGKENSDMQVMGAELTSLQWDEKNEDWSNEG